MKIGIVQLNSTDDLHENFTQIEKLVLGAATEKPEILFFPENSLFFRIDPATEVQTVDPGGEMVTGLKELCARAGISIHLTTAVKENDQTFNASLLIDTEMNARTVYRKTHLFDIELTGQTAIRESDAFAHGSGPATFSIGGFKAGSSICYDVRFAELYSGYAAEGVDLIVVPSAFLVKTGQAHWEVLLRARAIESQCYVVAPAQSGVHRSAKSSQTRETYGHSMLVSPWGEIRALKQIGVGVLFAELNKEEIENVRRQIPMHNHRRLISK